VRFPITADVKASHYRDKEEMDRAGEGCAIGKGWHGASCFEEEEALSGVYP
jgi:hypothetical protein